MKQLAEVLNDASPVEAKYISRIVTGKMRLGVAAMTVIDALAIAFATKEERDSVERAFNISSDLGMVAEVLTRSGLEGVKNIHVTVGNPIRVMLAERMSSPVEILERMGGAAPSSTSTTASGCRRTSGGARSRSTPGVWRTSPANSRTWCVP